MNTDEKIDLTIPCCRGCGLPRYILAGCERLAEKYLKEQRHNFSRCTNCLLFTRIGLRNGKIIESAVTDADKILLRENVLDVAKAHQQDEDHFHSAGMWG